MALRLYAMTCGWLTMPLGFALQGAKGTIRLPVPCYLVDHPRGKVLFDSGMHLASQTEPDDYMGAFATLFRVHFQPGEEIAARLQKLDIDAREILYLVNSHLHFDHAGGNAQIPDAPIVIQRREWEAGREPDLIQSCGYKPTDYDLGQDVIQVTGEHDLFGDGSVVCFPTYGHTPGHQSLRVRLETGEVILTADACYFRQTLEELNVPPIAHDPGEMRKSLEKLRELQARGARIFYGHDPEFWKSVPQAPAPVA
jgi:glyoxylase-like metal-dependent hydrolase (beta-lactamase superfamily II)